MIDLDLWPTFSGYMFGKHVPSPRHPPHLLVGLFCSPYRLAFSEGQGEIDKATFALSGGKEDGWEGKLPS